MARRLWAEGPRRRKGRAARGVGRTGLWSVRDRARRRAWGFLQSWIGGLQENLRLGMEQFGGSFVPDNGVGQFQLPRKRELGGEDELRGGLIESARFDHAPLLGGVAGGDQDDAVGREGSGTFVEQ